jgi:hypothetical protein
MLRESLITVPVNDNDGHSLAAVSEAAQMQLAHAFNGVTTIAACGKWIDAKGKIFAEPVTQLITAYEPAPRNDAILRGIARDIGREAKQFAVYVRYASGDVEILDTLGEWKP